MCTACFSLASASSISSLFNELFDHFCSLFHTWLDFNSWIIYLWIFIYWGNNVIGCGFSLIDMKPFFSTYHNQPRKKIVLKVEIARNFITYAGLQANFFVFCKDSCEREVRNMENGRYDRKLIPDPGICLSNIKSLLLISSSVSYVIA